MPSQLEVSKVLNENTWQVVASVVPGGILPQAIFVYENSGTSELGTFYGLADVRDLTRMQIWQGSAIPTFGNKFILHTQAKINVDKDSTPDSVIATLVNSVKLLSTSLASTSSTQVINIP